MAVWSELRHTLYLPPENQKDLIKFPILYPGCYGFVSGNAVITTLDYNVFL